MPPFCRPDKCKLTLSLFLTVRCALGRVDLSTLSAQNLVDPDPQFESILPRVRRLIYEAAGESMAVDAFQLDPILNCLLKDDPRLPYTMVSLSETENPVTVLTIIIELVKVW